MLRSFLILGCLVAATQAHAESTSVEVLNMHPGQTYLAKGDTFKSARFVCAPDMDDQSLQEVVVMNNFAGVKTLRHGSVFEVKKENFKFESHKFLRCGVKPKLQLEAHVVCETLKKGDWFKTKTEDLVPVKLSEINEFNLLKPEILEGKHATFCEQRGLDYVETYGLRAIPEMSNMIQQQIFN